MKRLSSIIFSFLYLSGCSSLNDKTLQQTKQVEAVQSDTLKFSIGKKYFGYDQIDHYFNDFDDGKFSELNDNPYKSIVDSIKAGVIIGPIPHNISDIFFINELEKAGFKKDTVKKVDYGLIDKIFSERVPHSDSASACVAIYRDILIFKMRSKVVGIVKLCFRCKQSEVFGALANTGGFGEDGDYEKLSSILRQ